MPRVEQDGGALVVADLAFREQQRDGADLAVADGMQLGGLRRLKHVVDLVADLVERAVVAVLNLAGGFRGRMQGGRYDGLKPF